MKPGLLAHWLSVVYGFKILLKALQEHVYEHPTVLVGPWSWESRQMISWGYSEILWLMPLQLLTLMTLSYINSFGLTF